MIYLIEYNCLTTGHKLSTNETSETHANKLIKSYLKNRTTQFSPDAFF